MIEFIHLTEEVIHLNEMDKLNGMLIPRDMLLSEKKYDEIQDNIKA